MFYCSYCHYQCKFHLSVSYSTVKYLTIRQLLWHWK